MNNNETMRVGINAVSLLSPLTGVGHYTLNLARALQALPGLELAYFYGMLWRDRCYRDEPPVDDRLPTTGGRQPALPRLVNGLKHVIKAVIPNSYGLARLLQQRAFAKGVRERRLTVYHDPNFIPFKFDGPTVITVHDLSLLKYPETHPQDRLRAIGRALPQAIERADAIIVVSEFIRRELLAMFSVLPDKVFAVHNGVGRHFQPMTAAATAPTLQRYGLRRGRYLLAVGTLEPRKNLVRLARAYRLLPAELQTDYPLVIVGMKGWRTEAIEQELAALARDGRVRLPGYIAAESLPALYAGAAALVYPSLYEGFGLPVAEAMACGTPVITSERSAMAEVVADAGVLVDPLDEAALAAAIQQLLAAPATARRLSERGLERAKLFSWERCARETQGIYQWTLQADRKIVA